MIAVSLNGCELVGGYLLFRRDLVVIRKFPTRCAGFFAFAAAYAERGVI
jgi:hypothetical protein